MPFCFVKFDFSEKVVNNNSKQSTLFGLKFTVGFGFTVTVELVVAEQPCGVLTVTENVPEFVVAAETIDGFCKFELPRGRCPKLVPFPSHSWYYSLMLK